MSDTDNLVRTEFAFIDTTVKIIEGDILNPGVSVDAVVSSDDNHLTMGSGISHLLAELAGEEYIREAQAQCPVPAGTVVCTRPHGLQNTALEVRWVLHGTVIDYDTERRTEEIVYQTTINCLEKAEQLRIKHLLFPAFATGAGDLAPEVCAHQMCSAIKRFLATAHRIETIYVILKTPDAAGEIEKNQRFIAEANLVLDVPYDPTQEPSQCRDFYVRESDLRHLSAVIAGAQGSKRHVLIAGGPRIGKSALLYELLRRANSVGGAGAKQRVVQVTFGRVHRNTPASFIFRKLLLALLDNESDRALIGDIKRAYANALMDCATFLQFLDDHTPRYDHVVFLLDGLPKLLEMVDDDFWDELERLGSRVHLIFTALAGKPYDALRARFSAGFKADLEEIALLCISDQERDAWVADLFQRYLDRRPGPDELEFFKQQAGRHPYLLSLAGYASIVTLKRGRPLRNATEIFEQPRRSFFESLLIDRSLEQNEKNVLESLAVATYIEEATRALIQGVMDEDRSALERFEELRKQKNPRPGLDQQVLKRLELRGYLADAGEPKTAQFMAKSFEDWVQAYVGVGDRNDDKPRDVVIGLLNPEPDVLSTLFGRRGARLVSARKQLPKEIRDKFLKEFRARVSTSLARSSELQKLDDEANFILTYFATDEIKAYLQNPPDGATILLTIDDALKDIPWELMIEFAYPGYEAPFKMGRSIVSAQSPHNIRPPVRGEEKIRALLIGDPTGDLSDARTEVTALYTKLLATGQFDIQDEDVRIGPDQCGAMDLLRALSSGRYGLIHYSGHSKSDGQHSAWLLKDGRITTDLLTNALQNAPPVFVFSSSCESAASGELLPAEFENQTFDLPSAFLQAGVEAYIGTLWSVDSEASRFFVEAFYGAFLEDPLHVSIGECLWRAKRAIRRDRDRLAFILYGDPHAQPAELFPVLAPRPLAIPESAA